MKNIHGEVSMENDVCKIVHNVQHRVEEVVDDMRKWYLKMRKEASKETSASNMTKSKVVNEAESSKSLGVGEGGTST